MKQTIFKHFNGTSIMEHKIDFIYELPTKKINDAIIEIKDKGTFSIVKIIDEFTDNPSAQIRHISLAQSEKQIL